MKSKNLILLALAVLSFIPLKAQTTVFQFTFENTEVVTVENAVGIPAFSAVGVNAANYFGGVTILDCPTTTGFSRSFAGWNIRDCYQFTVKITASYNRSKWMHLGSLLKDCLMYVWNKQWENAINLIKSFSENRHLLALGQSMPRIKRLRL